MVKFFEYFDFNNCLYFILECVSSSPPSDRSDLCGSYIEGGSLHTVMKKFGLFPEALLSFYIRQVLSGLQYLHEQGVIHRYVCSMSALTGVSSRPLVT